MSRVNKSEELPPLKAAIAPADPKFRYVDAIHALNELASEIEEFGAFVNELGHGELNNGPTTEDMMGSVDGMGTDISMLQFFIQAPEYITNMRGALENIKATLKTIVFYNV